MVSCIAVARSGTWVAFQNSPIQAYLAQRITKLRLRGIPDPRPRVTCKWAMHYDWSYWHFDKVGTSSEPFLDASLYPCIILGETLSGPRVPSYLIVTLQYSP
jgi:hypothetical protein